MGRRRVLDVFLAAPTLDRGEPKQCAGGLKAIEVRICLVHLLLGLILLVVSFLWVDLSPAVGQSLTYRTRAAAATARVSVTTIQAPGPPPSSRPPPATDGSRSPPATASWWSKHEEFVEFIVIPVLLLIATVWIFLLTRQMRNIEREDLNRSRKGDQRAREDSDSFRLAEVEETIKEHARRITYVCGDLQTRRVRLNDLRGDVGVWPTRPFRCGAAPFSRHRQLYEDYERQSDTFMEEVRLALQAIEDFKIKVQQLPERRRPLGDDVARHVRGMEGQLLRLENDEAHILMGEVNETLDRIAQHLLDLGHLLELDRPGPGPS
jgi:hypothetical protein